MKSKLINRKKKTGRLNKGLLTFYKNAPLSAMALPGIIVLIVFNYVPLFGLILPFKDYRYSDGFWGSKWVGLQNFKFLFESKDMFVATRNTILYNLVFIFVGAAVSVIIALMLFELSRKSVKFYQTSMMLPYFVSWVVASFILNALLDADRGIINKLLSRIGVEGILWYNEPKYWPVIIVLSSIWKGAGYSAVVYYAALMGLDQSCFEAAEIDGANKLQQIWYISIPGIKSMVIIMMIMAVGNILRGDFGLFYNVPMNSSLLYSTTDVIDTFIYRALLNLGDIGMSSAAGFYQACVGFVLVVLTNVIVRKIDSESALF